jgi:hypothetical protein
MPDMLLVGDHPRIISAVIPTFNQDGRQAKNRKKGDEI